ncbi:MAG: aldo/keto reductase [Pseudomonadota bacterium]
MEKRPFGNTGLEVSVIGFGGMTIGGAFGPVDDRESTAALHAAIDGGMNFIDTSNAYGEGHSESVIGKFLTDRPDRDQILVFSKGGNNMVTRTRNFAPAYIASCLEESLVRLGRSIDFYMLHNPNIDDMSAEDAYAALEKARDAGKIRHWGVSLNSAAECDFALEQARVAGLQMEYNVANQSAHAAFIAARQRGTAVIARVPLARGFLSGRFSPDHEFAEGDSRQRNLSRDNMLKLAGQLDRVETEARDLGVTAAALAQRFCVSHAGVSCVIPGIRTAAQARDNALACDPLPPDVLSRLTES